MIQAHINTEKRVSVWAAIAAPLVGVPLMVALLSLTAPKHETPVDGADLGPTTEHVQRQVADHASGLLAKCTEPSISS